MPPEATAWQDVRETFRRIWGYEDFRPPQGEIVNCLLEGQDALVVMPTGVVSPFVFSSRPCYVRD